MMMGHADTEGRYGGIKPGILENVLDENFISDKVDNVVLASCRMGESPLACSSIADAFEAPVSGQLGQSWGGGAIPLEHRGSGSLEDRTFVPNWGEADYATYTKDREEALDTYSKFRPNKADPEAVQHGFNVYEENIMRGMSPNAFDPIYKGEDGFIRGMKIRDLYNYMSKDQRFNNNKLEEILKSHPDGYVVRERLSQYYGNTLKENVPVRLRHLQGTRN